jgi:hypothetical protein
VADEPITSVRELREELDAVVGRTRDAPFLVDRSEEPARVAPDDDEPWRVTDIISEMMAGAYTHGTSVELYGYSFWNACGEHGNVWIVYAPDGEQVVDGLNLGAFRTASEIETFLLEEVHDRGGTAGPWSDETGASDE